VLFPQIPWYDWGQSSKPGFANQLKPVKTTCHGSGATGDLVKEQSKV